MKEIKNAIKSGNYLLAYTILYNLGYEYSIESIKRDFHDVDSINIFCFLIYLLSKENSINHVLLVCDFLTFSDTFFYDVYPVIHMILSQALTAYDYNKELLEWIVCSYDGHPESPFSQEEISAYKGMLSK